MMLFLGSGKSVSDLKTGERTGSKGRRCNASAAGVAHTLSPTLGFRLRIGSSQLVKRQKPQEER